MLKIIALGGAVSKKDRPTFVENARHLLSVNRSCDGEVGDIGIYSSGSIGQAILRSNTFSFFSLDCGTLTPETLRDHLTLLEKFFQNNQHNMRTPFVDCRKDSLFGDTTRILIGSTYRKTYEIPPFEYIVLHLYGIPSRELVETLYTLSGDSVGEGGFEDTYPHIAISMELFTNNTAYNVMVKSSIFATDSKLKLNHLESRLPIVNTFQKNLVIVKQTVTLPKLILGLTSDFSAPHYFKDIENAILGFQTNDAPPTWEEFVSPEGTFNFEAFHPAYDDWVLSHGFKKNRLATLLIGSNAKASGYKKAKAAMQKQFESYKKSIESPLGISDPDIAAAYSEKAPKFLSPVFYCLDFRSNRTQSIPTESPFKFDAEGAAELMAAQRTFLRLHLSETEFDLGHKRIYINEASLVQHQLEEASVEIFKIYLKIKQILPWKKDPTTFLSGLRDHLLATEHGTSIMEEIHSKYGFDLNGMISDTTKDKAKESDRASTEEEDCFKKSISSVLDYLDKTIVRDASVQVKSGKSRKRVVLKPENRTLAYILNVLDGLRIPFGTSKKFRRDGRTYREIVIRGEYKDRLMSLKLPSKFPYIVSSERNIIGKLIYVVLANGEMRFAIENKNNKSPRPAHSQLAEMGPTLDAGELFLSPNRGGSWTIVKINNASGHYRPNPSDGLNGVKGIIEKLLKGNPYFEIERDCALVNARSATRLSAIDESTQVLGSNF